MQRRLSGIRLRVVCVCTSLNQELTQPPVSVKNGSGKAQIVAERLQACALLEQELHGADVAIIGTPLEQGDTVLVGGICGMAIRKVFEDQIRAAIANLFRYRHGGGY